MKISFPHLGNYCVPIRRLLEKLFPDAQIITPPTFTRKTIELGCKYSPDFVCMPFKYNLGNFIEALELGANLLFQSSGGCRYSYYLELQNEILKELGYEFQMLNFFSDPISLRQIYAKVKAAGSNKSFFSFVYNVLLTIKMIEAMDEIDFYIRENIGFEKNYGSFEMAQAQFLHELKDISSLAQLKKVKSYYYKKIHSIEVEKPSKIIKIGLIGELYSLMEPFANYFIEKELAKNGAVITRFTNVSYLLFKKPKQEKKLVRAGGLKYHLGADGTESVAHLKGLAKKGYDGIIHLKPFGCTPEVNAMPLLMKASEELKIPVLYFSFDSQSSEVGIKTRLEAFFDMINMRKSNSFFFNNNELRNIGRQTR